METGSPEARLQRLERIVESLSAEVAQLRQGRLSTAAGEPFRPYQPPTQTAVVPGVVTADGRRTTADASAADGRRTTADASAADGRRTTADASAADAFVPKRFAAADIEGLIGRYGMLALATITGLAAVGTFIGWAASRAHIGPEARLAMGLALALALAGVGAWLRPRERSFGAVLLGLALAVAHVCAWGAGPAVMGLAPAWLTLTLALIVSAALAAFAHREDDQPLWCVGFGGAAIAPFVTSSGSGSMLALTLYGGAVLLLGCWALRGREWPIAGRVLTVAGLTYVMTLIAAPESTGAPLMALALATVVAGAGVLPFTGLAMRRGRLRAFGAMAAMAAFDISNFAAAGVPAADAIAIAAAALAWLLFLDRSAELPAGSLLDGLVGEGSPLWDFVDASLIPLAFLGATFDAVTGPHWHDGLVALAHGAAMFLFALRRPVSPLRNAAVLTACIATLTGAWWTGYGHDNWGAVIMTIPALAFLAARRRLPAAPWMLFASITLVVCSIGAVSLLGSRAVYAYRPFATRESLVALLVAAAWGAAALLAHDHRRLFQVALGSFAFAWVHQELYDAFSPTASTLLIISYYAVMSVVLVGAGRNLTNATLRHIGLLMALVAAGAAVRGAANLEAVWAQIAGFLVTSVFLLGIAWWYRQRNETATTVPGTEYLST